MSRFAQSGGGGMGEFRQMTINPGVAQEVYVAHITDPEHFYVQLSKTSGDLDALMDQLHEKYDTMDGNMSRPALGSACVAQYSEDNGWYRATITGLLKSGMIEVKFVDYGNSECVSLEKVKDILPEFLAAPVMGLHCGLTGVATTQGFWAPEHTVQFEDLALDQTFQATFHGMKSEDGIHSIELVSAAGKNINKDFGQSTNTTCVEEGTSIIYSRRQVHMGQGDSEMHVSVHVKGAAAYSNGDSDRLPGVEFAPGPNEVEVVYAFTPGEFYCQLVKNSDVLTNLGTMLASEYGKLRPGECTLQSPRKGMFCAAKFCEDDCWYRGEIKSVGQQEIEVYFIDYGNTEKIAVDLVKDLKPNLKSEPSQAIKCLLSNLKSSSGSWSDAAAEKFENLTLGKHLLAVPDGRTVDGKVPVKMKDPVEGYFVAEKLAAANHGIIAKSTIPRVPGHLVKTTTYNNLDIRVPSETTVFSSWTENPSQFWVQIENNQSTLDNLVERVQELYANEATPVRSILPGMAVVAQYSEDQAWYRGVVQKMRGKKVEVLFVDFGNSDTVSADTLKEVNSSIGSVPVQAVQCCLSGVRPMTSDWTEDAKAILEDVIKDGALCSFLSVQNNSYEVKLSVGGKDVASELVAAGVAKKGQGQSSAQSPPSVAMKFRNHPSLPVGQTDKAFVSHIDSLDSFWCQLVSTTTQLNDLMEQLEGFYSQGNGIQLPSPQPGMSCVSKFSEDQSWYRAVIQGIDGRNISVHFVDYGNSEVAPSTSVCSIGTQFMNLPTQAMHCKLAVSSAVTDDMINQFHDLVNDKEVVLKVLSVERDCLVVDLLDSNQSITAKLKEQFPTLQSSSSTRPSASNRLDFVAPSRPTSGTEKVFITFTESPESFYVHIANIDSELDAIRNKLKAFYGGGSQGPIASPNPGQPCGALYALDGDWYRGRIVSSQGNNVTVNFVDYGNADVVTGADIKPLSPEFLMPGPFALECGLENIESKAWSDEAIAFFETLTVDKELTCQFKPGKLVSLTVDGKDIAQAMEEKGFLKRTSGGNASRNYNPPIVPAQPNPAFVTHVEEDGIFYVQLASAEDLVNELSERLQDLYTAAASTSSLIYARPGMPCCAKFSEDESWYRAVVENVSGQTAHVRFVDFGNTDQVKVNEIKELEVDFLPIPPLAFQCKMKELPSWRGSQKEKFTSLTTEKEIIVKFLTKVTPYSVDLTLDSENLVPKLTEAASPQRSFQTPTSPPRRNEAPFQKKPTSPPSAGSGWDSPPKASKPSFGSGQDRGSFGSRPPKQDSGDSFGSRPPRQNDSFGSRPPRQDSSDSFGSRPPRQNNDSFGSRPPRQDKGDSFGSRPPRRDQNESWGSGGSGFGAAKAASPPKPTLEKIPAAEQIYATPSVPSEELRVCISHVEGDSIYVQSTKDLNNVMVYSTKIKKLPKVEVTPAVGLACGALFSDDGTWYRGKVSQIDGEKISVLFVDFGNSDVVGPANLKQLNRELLGIAPIAFCCRLDGVKKLTPELTDLLAKEAADKELNVKFLTQESPMTAKMVTQDGKDLTQLLCPSKFPDATKPSQVLPGVVSNISSDGTFYIQLIRDQEAMKTLEEQLGALYAKGTINISKSLEVEKPCCARHPDDLTWQRGIIQEINDDKVKVQFIDLGVCESVKSAFVQQLPRSFMLTPPYAYQCILKDFTSWTDEQREKFINMTDGKTMNIQFCSDKAPFKVEMSRSVGLELMGDTPEIKRHSLASSTSSKATEMSDKATPSTLPEQELASGESAYVCFVDTDGSFYMQLASEEEKLTEVTDALQAEYSESGGEKVFGLDVDMLCCAKFTEDDAWYRARVISIEDASISVRFMDYGNTDVVTIDRVAVLSSANMSSHPLAYKCSLAGVKFWTEQLIEKFDEATKEKTLTVTLEKQTSLFMVDLKLEEGEDVKEKLADAIAEAAETAGGNFKWTKLEIGKTASVYVSHVDSSLNFWVQDVTGETQLAELSTAISDGYQTGGDNSSQPWMDEGAAVVAKYAEDEQWYRGRILSVGDDKCKVQFVDYGNADDVAKSDIYLIKKEHLQLPAQAVSCRLNALTVVEGKDDAAMDALFEVTNEKAVSLDAITELKGEDVRYTVSLSCDGVVVRDKLIADELCTVDDSAKDSNDVQSPNASILTELSTQQSPNSKILTEMCKDPVPSPFPAIELTEGQRISVHILHSVTPSEFYVQPESSTHGLDELMENMYEYYNDLAEGDMTVDEPKSGQACACVFGEEGSWYRAKICGISEGKCAIFYVDYSNSELVATSAIRQLPEQFMKLPAQSVQCSLAGVRSKESAWSREAISLFEEMTSDKTLIMDILTVSKEGNCVVHLLHMGMAINQVLLEKDFGIDAATPVPISKKVKRIFSDASDPSTPQKLNLDAVEEETEETPGNVGSTLNVGEQYTLSATHIVNPHNFSCQLTSSAETLQRLKEQLQTLYKESADVCEVSQITEGLVCVARFPQDDQYFRAKVLTVKDSEAEVQLLDYGHSETAAKEDILAVKEESLELPYQAFMCCLTEVDYKDGEWSKEALDTFRYAVEDKELTAKVISGLKKNCLEVELFTGEESVGKMLVDKDLAVVKEEDDDDIKKRIEHLIDPFPSVESHETPDTKYTTSKHSDGFLYLELASEKEYTIKMDEDSILDQFILYLSSVTKLVEDMMKDIEEYMKDAEENTDWEPVIGQSCLVKKPSETRWFRGKIVNVEEELSKVYLVDYREMIQVSKDSIRELPARFLEIPVNGFKCQLADVAPVDGTWSQEAETHFHDFSSDNYLSAFLVSQSEEGLHNVRLQDNDELGGATINRQLVDIGVAMPLPGSLIEMELQMEHASKDTSVLEELEQSFHDVSYHRENSLGEDSDVQQDVSGELCQTFNTTGHSLLDQTADITTGPDATLELVGDTSTLEDDRDLETPRPESAKDICHDIVENIVKQTNEMTEAEGKEVCKEIVDDLVNRNGDKDDDEQDQNDDEQDQKDEESDEDEAKDVDGQANEKIESDEENDDADAGESVDSKVDEKEDKTETKIDKEKDDADVRESVESKVDEKEDKTETGSVDDENEGDKTETESIDEDESEKKDGGPDEAESDQQKTDAEENFEECEDESEEESSKASGDKDFKDDDVKNQMEGTESGSQDTQEEDSPECEKDEFYEADDGGSESPQKEKSAKTVKCQKENSAIEDEDSDVEGSDNESAEGDSVKDGTCAEADATKDGTSDDCEKSSEKTECDKDIQQQADSQLAEEDH